MKDGGQSKDGTEKPQTERPNCRKCLKRWGKAGGQEGGDGERENRKSISQGSGRMKIEG